MKGSDLERYKIDQLVRVIFFSVGLAVALVLALVDSQYTAAAFSFVGGLLGGSVMERKL